MSSWRYRESGREGPLLANAVSNLINQASTNSATNKRRLSLLKPTMNRERQTKKSTNKPFTTHHSQFTKKMKILALLLLTSFGFQQTQTYTEEQKISFLIAVISKLDAKFVRNGSEYSPQDAADHLKMKRKKAGNRIKTAREFIDGIASKSSQSGEKYTIKFKDGHVEDSGAYLLKQLVRLESKASSTK